MTTATKKTLKPLSDKVIVQKLEPEEKTRGGILLPDTTKEKPQEGKVIAVGPGAVDDKGQRKPMDVKESDHVLFAKYSGTEVKLEGEEYLILSERDILAIVK
ncbi:MAG: co-chaperone GroES [Candidatus Melainabacteria bacterium RIFCSPLOWO2_02_FULL_35_15]|nr:MAG: co-chaperone GroES [Candidatus Melainabacteria bacterium RIFCSPLOWO2_12_FULL_35_11]OGI13775.1 MAG: co-chaperone GroES [Candidatus Melainabacteria bacterium RIFCSPLOWO2_02_FULL_35_15]